MVDDFQNIKYSHFLIADHEIWANLLHLNLVDVRITQLNVI